MEQLQHRQRTVQAMESVYISNSKLKQIFFLMLVKVIERKALIMELRLLLQQPLLILGYALQCMKVPKQQIL